MIKTIRVPGQIRRHVIKNVDPKTKGERDLKEASLAGARELEANEMNSLNTIELHLTNEAIGVALDIARDWLHDDNGNNVMAGKSMLKFELEYEPDDPREIRHQIKMPKSIAGHFAPKYGHPSPYKNESETIHDDMDRMSWSGTGASGRVRAETLGFLLDNMGGLKENPHPATSRAAKKFLATFTEPYEKTQRLINGHLGTGEGEDQAPETLTAAGFMEAIHGRGPEMEEVEPVKAKRPPLVLVACGGKKSTARSAPAGEMYVGNYHQACRNAAEVMDGPTMILSAKYGLLPLEQSIDRYDMVMGDPDAIEVSTLKIQARNLGLENARVTILGGAKYVQAARGVWPDAEAPLTGGIGKQLQQLAGIYGGDALDDDEHQDQEEKPEGPEDFQEGKFRDIPHMPGRNRSHEPVIWYGGKAGVAYYKPQGWQKVKVIYTGEGKYDLIDLKTGKNVRTCTLATQLYWATVQQDQEPAVVEETAPPKGGYEVPANFLELAEEGNTDEAKAYWKRRCEEYRRTGK
jgi:hypothetical protein